LLACSGNKKEEGEAEKSRVSGVGVAGACFVSVSVCVWLLYVLYYCTVLYLYALCSVNSRGMTDIVRWKVGDVADGAAADADDDATDAANDCRR